MRFICVLIIEALHGKDGHVLAAASVQGAREFPPTFFYPIRLVNSLLDIIFIIDATTAVYT
jgi:hypothetical protein